MLTKPLSMKDISSKMNSPKKYLPDQNTFQYDFIKYFGKRISKKELRFFTPKALPHR